MEQSARKYTGILSSPVAGILLTGLILILFSILPFRFNRAVSDADIDLLFRLRGSRLLSEKILFVFIGPDDVRELGGWPITRDYYGYLIHILQQRGARAIGLDVLFDKADRVYPEYDTALAEFIASAGNVCLPLAYTALSKVSAESDGTGARFRGVSPVYPYERFREKAAGCGFSNLGPGSVLRRVPVAAMEKDSLRLSFGAALAGIYLNKTDPPLLKNNALLLSGGGEKIKIPLTPDGLFLLNHFGGTESIHKTGLIDLLQTYENFPDSLDLHDKAVIVGVTLPGVSSTAATPLTGLLPASLIHATVAENIISGNFLRQTSGVIDVAIMLVFVIMALVLWRFFTFEKIAFLLPGVIAFYWIVAVVLFSRSNILLPLLYPTAVFLTASAGLLISHTLAQRREMLSRRQLLERSVSEKEHELKTARENLSGIQEQLADSGTQSEQLKKLAEERKQTILRLESELRDLQSYRETAPTTAAAEFPEIIRSEGSRMEDALEMVHRIREDDIPVLILGETGTGKEVIARTIHNTSRRSKKPFVAVNCGALPENLLDSELFGHEKGSFTGAHARRRGRFELADGGTVFLDEITETTPAFQARLLRVLQEGSFERLGGEVSLKVDVRIIAASNRDLQKELDSGRFRPDLYYRLNGLQIPLPPLRERKEDIPPLVKHFLLRYDYQLADQISGQAMEVLKNYSWPGNVRELENSIRRAAIMAQGAQRKMIRIDDLPAEVTRHQLPAATDSAYLPLEKQVLEMLQSQEFSHSSISATARMLGNRDRGTITEYLRGICFETLAENDFDIERSARIISASSDRKVIERVRRKINAYLDNLNPLPGEEEIENFLGGKTDTLPQVKNLPQKYHPALITVIRHLKK